MSTPHDPEQPTGRDEDPARHPDGERPFTSAPREGEQPRPMSRSFRVLTLLAGLALFVVVVLLLLR